MNASCDYRESTLQWIDLSGYNGLILLCDDFNMTEIIENRHLGKGHSIRGKEAIEWGNLVDTLGLVDVSHQDSGYTWSNMQIDDSF